MRLVPLAAVTAILASSHAHAQQAPAWFTSGPRYERAAKCIAAIMYFPQIEDNRGEFGFLQRAITNDGQMDTDLQLDVRTEGDPPRLRVIDMVMRHVYASIRNFQTQPISPSVLRTACRKFESELAR